MKRPGRRHDPADTEILCGLNPVLEQLRRDPRRIRRIRVAQGSGRGSARVAAEARQAGVEVIHDDPRRLEDLSAGVVHQGVIAEIEPHRYAELADVLEARPDCLLVADQVTDPRNLGAMIRSAEAAGAGGIVLPRDRSAGVTAVTAKASAGATALLPVSRVTNLARALEDLKRAGYWIVGLDPQGPRSLFALSFPSPCAIVVGSEGRGLRPLTRSACDYLVSIPMSGRVGSLNVSVAAAVALFERFRQRHAIDSPPQR